jgi:hypothetical protein
VNPTLTNQISAEALVYAPLALNAVQGIEAAAAATPGATKSEIAVNIVLAAATAAEGVPVPAVSAIASLVALLVSAANAFGVFKHKAPAPAPPAAPVNLFASQLGASQLMAQGTSGAAGLAAAQGYGQQTAPPFGTQPVANVTHATAFGSTAGVMPTP